MCLEIGLISSSRHSNKLGMSARYSVDSAGVINIILNSSSIQVNSVINCDGVKILKHSKSKLP
jgi:hypothetical protein